MSTSATTGRRSSIQNPYQVDLDVGRRRSGSTIDRAEAAKTMTQVSGPYWYTGGDVSPVPLPGRRPPHAEYQAANNGDQVSTAVPAAWTRTGR